MFFCHHINWIPDKYKNFTNGEPTSICQTLLSVTGTITVTKAITLSCRGAFASFPILPHSSEVPANRTERWVVLYLPHRNTNFIIVIHAGLFLDFGIFIDLFLLYYFLTCFSSCHLVCLSLKKQLFTLFFFPFFL